MSNHTLTRQTARIARHMPLVLLALVTLLGLCGCVDKTGEPPSKREVLAYVSEKCPTENIELQGVSQTGREPDEYAYTFRSTERDLTFTARSYLRQLYFDATPLGWYEPTVSCDYAEQVHASYDARMTDVLVDSGLYGTYGGGESSEEPRVSTGRIVIRGEKDFAAAARCLARMSDLYAAEAVHNTAD